MAQGYKKKGCQPRCGLFDSGGRHPRWTDLEGPWRSHWVWGREFYRRHSNSAKVIKLM